MTAAMPARGVPAAQVLAEIEALRRVDLPTHGGPATPHLKRPT